MLHKSSGNGYRWRWLQNRILVIKYADSHHSFWTAAPCRYWKVSVAELKLFHYGSFHFSEPDLFGSELVVGSKLTQIQISLWGTHLSDIFCCRTFSGRGRIRIRNSKILDTIWIYSTKKSLSAVWSRSRNSSLLIRLRRQILSRLYQLRLINTGL